MKKYTLVAFLVSLSLTVFAQDINFNHLRVEDGLSQPSVLSIYQDEFGIMWFATRDGLNRYNGKEIEVFNPIEGDTTSLFANNVRYVCGDLKGTVYVHAKYSASAFDLEKQKFRLIKPSNVMTINYGANNLWIATRDSIFSYNNKNKLCTPHFNFNNIKIHISALQETKKKELYIGSQGQGVYVLDKEKKLTHLLPQIHVTSFYEDVHGRIWISTRWTGLYVVKDGQVIANYKHKKNNTSSISSDFTRSVCLDNLGNYWIATAVGLDKLDYLSQTFHHYEYSNNDPISLGNGSVWAVMKDKLGTIWIGTYFGGVDFFNPESGFYKIYSADKTNPRKLSCPVISRMTEDKQGNLWVGTEGGGLNYLNRKTNSFKNYRYHPYKNSISSDIVKTLLYDSDNERLWIGTHLGGLNCFDIKRNTFKKYLNDPNSKTVNQEDGIRHIIGYKDKIILGTLKGLNVFDKKTEKFSQLIESSDENINSRQILNMIIDKDSQLWFSTAANLYKYDLKNQKLHKVLENIENGNNISVIFQDLSGEIWLGTTGNGIGHWDKKTNKVYFFNKSNSDIINNYINDIKQASSGFLLISTSMGLSKLDTKQKIFYNYNQNNGFPFTATNENSLFVAQNNEIFLGGINGLLSFSENDLIHKDKPVRINLINIKVNNEKILPGDKSGILENSIYYTDKIELNHKHAILTIDFATTGYAKSLSSDIEYMLDGFDKKWTFANFTNSITYTNLSPGKYTLLMRLKKNNNKEQIRSLIIVVNPPFYKTMWAYMFYAAILLSIGIVLNNFYISKMKLKTSLEYEKKEKQRIEELNQFKFRFFTNISHEFRTPLTIINGQIETLLQMNDVKPSIYNKLLSIFRNTERMKRLITELIDFRKQEQGFLKIKAVNQNLTPFLSEIYLSFKEYAAARNIKFTFSHPLENIELWFDASEMEKVFYNLISNAFKYTPNGGAIDISVIPQHDSVLIIVNDTGRGIYDGDLDKIFDRFYQGEMPSDNAVKTSGSGIGLAVCNNIIVAHRGGISVESKANEGSAFTVKLLRGEDHLKANEKDYSPTVSNRFLTTVQSNSRLDEQFVKEVIESQAKNSNELPVMVIVEDDDDVRAFLKEIMSPFYKIILASDGKQGFNKIIEHQPDIILSDVMLPYMSGIELCSKIKTSIETCHIPMVLLTAQNSAEYTVQGLKTGADDYITKPFNVKILVSRCNNLINSRKVLQKKYANEIDISPNIIASNAIEMAFIEKAHEIIEANLTNSQFDVNLFAQEMAVGRSMLFAKIKGMTGQTPNELITNIRLKRAVLLLTTRHDLSIADISYEVGFSSPSYFIKCFRELYQQTPAGFRKRQKM